MFVSEDIALVSNSGAYVRTSGDVKSYFKYMVGIFYSRRERVGERGCRKSRERVH